MVVTRRSRMRSRAGATLVSLLVVLIVAGCAGDDTTSDSTAAAGGSGDDGETVKIGLIQDLSGATSVYAPAISQSVELAVSEVNADGGVLNQEIELVVGDSKADPRSAESEATRLIDAGVEALLVMTTAANRDAVLPAAEEAGIPMFFAWPDEGGVCNEVLFHPGQEPTQWSGPTVEYVMAEMGATEFYMLGNDYIWPRTMNELAAETIEDGGGEVVGEGYVPLGSQEFGTLVSQAMDAGEDVVVIANFVGGDLISFMKQYKAAGGSQTVMGFAGDEQTLTAMGADAEGFVAGHDYLYTLDTPANEAFLGALEEMFGSDVAPQTHLSVEGYDSVLAWAGAANEAGSTDLAAVSDAITDVEVEGGRGVVKFNEFRHMTLPNHVGIATGEGDYEVVADLGEFEPTDPC